MIYMAVNESYSSWLEVLGRGWFGTNMSIASLLQGYGFFQFLAVLAMTRMRLYRALRCYGASVILFWWRYVAFLVLIIATCRQLV